ncbi:UNKNOWN [Stylonychia lemnae]|uniref:Uncharacterized protein n=1 Tax=Stylonychia lemnae TaxID=5949 RepID=A0A078A3F1_STYLE|nr:UNKNOWN [Stylonychia lemnae]|eukprot:CDW76808.1 UNKNOWN [Stylonychia lemnae]
MIPEKLSKIKIYLAFNQILDIPNENKYFQHPCLNPKSGKCTADEYFKEISYQIDLQELYKIVSTCYFQDDMKYYPVILEVMPQKVRDSFNGCKYLLQVWDKQNYVDFWAICYQYLIYQVKDDDLIHGKGTLSINIQAMTMGYQQRLVITYCKQLH